MGRRGRPRKSITPIEKEKLQITDDIVNQIRMSAVLSQDQIVELKKALDDTLASYNMTKKYSDDNTEERTIKDINHEAVEAFLQAKRAESKSKSTLYNYGNELSKLFLIINKDYRDITAQDIRQFMDYRREHDGVRPVTIQNIRMYLMSFYKWAVTDERILRNPMDKIGTIRTERKVIETFTDEEVERLRCACKNERDLAIVDMLSSSGMRVSELTGLNRSDVNFETGEVKVFGKGSKERICFLTGRAKIHLKWYLDSRTDDNPALFVTAKLPHTRLTKNGVEFCIKELGRLSGVDLNGRCHPHKFRSTLATNMLNKGCDVSLVQQVLGHANADTTLQVYARIDRDTVKRAHHNFAS